MPDKNQGSKSPTSQDHSDKNLNKYSGAVKRLFSTQDGEMLKEYLVGTLLAATWSPGVDQKTQDNLEGQRKLARTILFTLGQQKPEGVLDA